MTGHCDDWPPMTISPPSGLIVMSSADGMAVDASGPPRPHRR